jgi:hypothetical protein
MIFGGAHSVEVFKNTERSFPCQVGAQGPDDFAPVKRNEFMTKVVEFIPQDFLIVIKVRRIPTELLPTNVITKLHDLIEDVVIAAMDYMDIWIFAAY